MTVFDFISSVLVLYTSKHTEISILFLATLCHCIQALCTGNSSRQGNFFPSSKPQGKPPAPNHYNVIDATCQLKQLTQQTHKCHNQTNNAVEVAIKCKQKLRNNDSFRLGLALLRAILRTLPLCLKYHPKYYIPAPN